MDRVTELLESLANKMGTTAEYLWPLLIQSTRVQAITEGGALLGSLIVASFIFNKLVRRGLGTNWDDSVTPPAVFIVGMVWLGVLITLLVESGKIVAGIFTPEAQTVMKILEQIR